MRNPLRSDALKRRQLLLDAAAEIFASQGYGAPLDSIAAKAGVGQGTLYRNFADRDELLGALIDRDLAGLEEALRDTALVEHPFAMLEIMAETSVVNPALAEYWTALPPESPVVQAGEQRFFALAGRGLAEAKAAGRLRMDLTPEDFCTIGIMFRAIRFGADEAERRGTKQRVMSILSQGIVP
jgi:AcrR family transcriptional regulator